MFIHPAGSYYDAVRRMVSVYVLEVLLLSPVGLDENAVDGVQADGFGAQADGFKHAG